MRGVGISTFIKNVNSPRYGHIIILSSLASTCYTLNHLWAIHAWIISDSRKLLESWNFKRIHLWKLWMALISIWVWGSGQGCNFQWFSLSNMISLLIICEIFAKFSRKHCKMLARSYKMNQIKTTAWNEDENNSWSEADFTSNETGTNEKPCAMFIYTSISKCSQQFVLCMGIRMLLMRM